MSEPYYCRFDGEGDTCSVPARHLVFCEGSRTPTCCGHVDEVLEHLGELGLKRVVVERIEVPAAIAQPQRRSWERVGYG